MLHIHFVGADEVVHISVLLIFSSLSPQSSIPVTCRFHRMVRKSLFITIGMSQRSSGKGQALGTLPVLWLFKGFGIFVFLHWYLTEELLSTSYIPNIPSSRHFWTINHPMSHALTYGSKSHIFHELSMYYFKRPWSTFLNLKLLFVCQLYHCTQHAEENQRSDFLMLFLSLNSLFLNTFLTISLSALLPETMFRFDIFRKYFWGHQQQW